LRKKQQKSREIEPLNVIFLWKKAMIRLNVLIVDDNIVVRR